MIIIYIYIYIYIYYHFQSMQIFIPVFTGAFSRKSERQQVFSALQDFPKYST